VERAGVAGAGSGARRTGTWRTCATSASRTGSPSTAGRGTRPISTRWPPPGR